VAPPPAAGSVVLAGVSEPRVSPNLSPTRPQAVTVTLAGGYREGVKRLSELERAADCHRFAADGLLGVMVYAMTLVVPMVTRRSGMGPLTLKAVLIGALVCGALAFRRRWPYGVLAVTTAGMAVYLVIGGERSPMMLATLIAVYTVTSASTRGVELAAAGAVTLVLVGTAVTFGGRWWFGTEVFGLVAQCALATAIGDAVRNGRAYVAAIEERAQRAERSREEEASRRVVGERLRIARELHDVLAHHIALINVQAGVAAHVMETEPDQARESLAHIRRAGRAALEELRTTVGLLRQPNAPSGLVTEPVPGLDQLPDLLASFAATGLVVEQTISGPVRCLPATVDLAAYRIVQEALTNASKHAGGAGVTLDLGYDAEEVRIVVADRGDGVSASDGTGHGLLGMRERALSVGGVFAAGRRAGLGFEVRAALPAPAEAARSDAARSEAARSEGTATEGTAGESAAARSADGNELRRPAAPAPTAEPGSRPTRTPAPADVVGLDA
jgi:signal transduction histidine kinase